MIEFPDSNNNGIPDAFENRRPISEILREEESEPSSYAKPVSPQQIIGAAARQIEELVELVKEAQRVSVGHQTRLHHLEKTYRQLRRHSGEQDEENASLTGEINRLRSKVKQFEQVMKEFPEAEQRLRELTATPEFLSPFSGPVLPGKSRR